MMTSIMKKDVEGRETNNAQIFNGVLSVSWRIVFNKNKRWELGACWCVSDEEMQHQKVAVSYNKNQKLVIYKNLKGWILSK